jgi:hypothetical protein
LSIIVEQVSNSRVRADRSDGVGRTGRPIHHFAFAHPPLTRKAADLGALGLALVAGLAAVAALLPAATIAGTGGVFRFPHGDLSQNLVGHLAFQNPGWYWPPLRAPALAWPVGVSIAMTDSNPALSVVAKSLAMVTGHRMNLMGAWLALCLVMQPLAALYALRGFRHGAAPPPRTGPLAKLACAAAASAMSLMLPAFLFRAVHINLFGQFLLLLALGLSVRCCLAERPAPFRGTTALLLLIVLVHPYLFMFSAIILAAPAVQLLVRRREGARPAFRSWALCVLLPTFAFMGLSESASFGGPGFGLLSMNLLGPFWPQLSGLFGATLPVLDVTGYQREGFNYLGAGILLLLAAGAICLARMDPADRRAMARRFAGLAICMVCLAGLAVTPRVTAGNLVLLPLDLPLLDRLFAVVRSSGRAIWLVDYALLLGCTSFLGARLRPPLLVPLLAVSVCLQWYDTAPLREGVQAYFAGYGETAPPIEVPEGTTLFSVVPWCSSEEFNADSYRLAAFRAGAHLKEVRLSHPPDEAACAAALRAALETPLQPGEARLFLNSAHLNVRHDPLGAGVTCATNMVGMLCHRGRQVAS